MISPAASPTASDSTPLAIVDGDIHNTFASRAVLPKFLPARWRRHHELFGLRGHQGASYPRLALGGCRTDAWPASGPPGSDLDLMREQLLDRYNVAFGVLNPLIDVGGQLDLDYGAALAQAVNDWQIATWLEPEPRLRASIVIPYEDGELAAAEIDRVGDHPGLVQVLLLSRTNEPVGRRKYWKIYEAAERHGLPIGIHFGGTGGGPITGAGWPSFYLEDHVGVAQAMQAQVVSLVTEGVFERFPGLHVVLAEGGFAWLPPLMWRLDRAWEKLREEAPFLRRLPSEYIRDHLRLTTQPMEEPPNGRFFSQLLRQLGSDEMLMFATDYPHWDFDEPTQAFPTRLPEGLRQKIMAENARALYRAS